MRSNLGNPINRLIREIAYTKGEIKSQRIVVEKAQTQIAELTGKIKAACAAICQAEARVAVLKEDLSQKIDLSVDALLSG